MDKWIRRNKAIHTYVHTYLYIKHTERTNERTTQTKRVQSSPVQSRFYVYSQAKPTLHIHLSHCLLACFKKYSGKFVWWGYHLIIYSSIIYPSTYLLLNQSIIHSRPLTSIRLISTNLPTCSTHPVANASSVKRLLEARARFRIANVASSDMESASAKQVAYSDSVLAWKPGGRERGRDGVRCG